MLVWFTAPDTPRRGNDWPCQRSLYLSFNLLAAGGQRDGQVEGPGGLEVDHDRERSERVAAIKDLRYRRGEAIHLIFCRSSLITNAVMANDGNSRVVGSARSRLSASIPAIPGN